MKDRSIISNLIENKRFYFIYALILFSTSLILILISGVLQGDALKKMQQDIDIKNETINDKMSALQSVQQINEQLRSDLNSLKNEYRNLFILIGELKNQTESTKTYISVYQTISDAQQFYIEDKINSATDLLLTIKNPEELPEDLLVRYNKMADLLELPHAAKTDEDELSGAAEVINQ